MSEASGWRLLICPDSSLSRSKGTSCSIEEQDWQNDGASQELKSWWGQTAFGCWVKQTWWSLPTEAGGCRGAPGNGSFWPLPCRAENFHRTQQEQQQRYQFNMPEGRWIPGKTTALKCWVMFYMLVLCFNLLAASLENTWIATKDSSPEAFRSIEVITIASHEY